LNKYAAILISTWPQKWLWV